MNSSTAQFLAGQAERMEVGVLVAALADPVGPDWRGSFKEPRRNAFYFIRGGEGRVTIDGADYFPQPGELVLLPYGRDYAISTLPDKPSFRKYWCCFTASLPEGDFFQRLHLPCVVRVEDEERMEALFLSLIDGYSSPDLPRRLEAKAAILAILSEYLRLCGDSVSLLPRKSPHLLDEVLGYIREHLDEPLGVDALAERVHIHPGYLTKLFREATGETPVRYINRLRMDQAREKLVASSHSVGEVAAELGMDPVYFARLFRKHTGMSPSEYRRAVLPPSALERNERIGHKKL
ncbi:MAG: helix-turn-helix domain-containing protein [Oscillospiraceae bacterium]